LYGLASDFLAFFKGTDFDGFTSYSSFLSASFLGNKGRVMDEVVFLSGVYFLGKTGLLNGGSYLLAGVFLS
jgi:hypothetical protein